MIIDLAKFVARERPYWTELDTILNVIEQNPRLVMGVDQLRRLHYLYQRASADLSQVSTFSYDSEVRLYLEALVSRAYGEIQEGRETQNRFHPIAWFFGSFPRTFRRHLVAFWLSTLFMLIGSGLGALALAIHPDAKQIIFPAMFGHLQQSPSERVAEEEKNAPEDEREGHSTFSALLIRNNTRVSMAVLALGFTYGAGTAIALFYNGVILGTVCADYIMDGQSRFLVGWLLPHGSLEIPAILIAGQAGLLLASALFGWGNKLTLRQRLRRIGPDLVTLIGGVSVMLVWAGLVESFFSQYHEPVLPYNLKIGFGVIQLGLLILFLWRGGISPSAKTDRTA